MTNNWEKIKHVFSEAIRLDEGERMCYVKEACKGNQELINEIKSLINSYEEPSVLDKTIDSLRSTAFSATHTDCINGRIIGKYRLLEEIGSGGMGSVCLAERADGEFSQRVAIKLLKNAFATENQVDRFKSERQILASLEHDNIARLLDGGVTRNGQPYYVMEVVDGQPIDVYCDEQKMTLKQRLELFTHVCKAVQYAHRKLVVHRDLKPSNILVTSDGRIKLLDFGIAKVLDHNQPSNFDIQEVLPLTPSYASPEQVRGDAITTSSDIYQLGIVLYELLSGFRPFKIESHSPSEIEKSICKTVPGGVYNHFLSNRLTFSSNSDEIRKISENRGTNPRRLQKKLRGDINAIIMKALRKEPDKRYESADQFLNDIQRYLSCKTVIAHPTSKMYRAHKFIARNSIEIAVITTMLMLMIGYLITITWHSHQTGLAFEQAQQEADKSAQVVDFMLGMFEAGDPRINSGQLITAQDLLNRGLEEANQLQQQPALQANLYNVIGKVYTSLGLYNEAGEILEKAVRIQRTNSQGATLETARYLNDLAVAITRQGNYEQAYVLHEEALSILTGLFGDEHHEVANSLATMGSWVPVTGIKKAMELRKEALRINRSVYGENHLKTAESYMNVGRIQRSLAKPQDALNSFSRALEIRKKELGNQPVDVAESMIFMADVYRLYNLDPAKAEELYLEALAIQERTLGTEHFTRLHGLTGLASLYLSSNEFEKAEELLLKNVAIREHVFGEDHPSIAEGFGQLANGYLEAGNVEKAENYYRKSLDLWIKSVGPNHIIISGALMGLGNALVELEQFEEAENSYAEALAIQKETLGEDSGALVYGAMGGLYQKRGDKEAAEQYYRRALSMFEAHGSENHYDATRLKKELDSLLVLRN